MRLPFLGLLLLISSVAFLACTNDDDSGSEPTQPETSATDAPTDTPTEAPIPVEYEIAGREDVSFATTTRIVYRVSVSEPLTESSLMAIADEIIAAETASQDVNAIGFFFYLPGTDTNGAYTAGVADWAPNGDWAEADSVQAGDYSQHELGAIVVITP